MLLWLSEGWWCKCGSVFLYNWKEVRCRRAVLAESGASWNFAVNEWKSGAVQKRIFAESGESQTVAVSELKWRRAVHHKAECLELLLWMNEKAVRCRRAILAKSRFSGKRSILKLRSTVHCRISHRSYVICRSKK